MREFSKINQSVWASKKFGALSDHHKLFYLYCLSTKLGTSAGCFFAPVGYMMVDLRWSEGQILEAIDRVSRVGLISYDQIENTLLIARWFDFNPPTNPKHAAKIISDILSIAYTDLKLETLQAFSTCLAGQKWKLLEASQSILDSLYHTLSSKVATKTVTVTETVTETETKVLSPSAPKTKTESHGTRLPKDWDLPVEYASFARSAGMTEARIAEEAEKFRDYWHSVAGAKARKADWFATWRNWLRNNHQPKGQKNAARTIAEDAFKFIDSLGLDEPGQSKLDESALRHLRGPEIIR